MEWEQGLKQGSSRGLVALYRSDFFLRVSWAGRLKRQTLLTLVQNQKISKRPYSFVWSTYILECMVESEVFRFAALPAFIPDHSNAGRSLA